MENKIIDWLEEFHKDIDKRNLHVLLQVEALLHPTAIKHWDLKACGCDVCNIRRKISKALIDSEVLYDCPMLSRIEDVKNQLVFKYKDLI